MFSYVILGVTKDDFKSIRARTIVTSNDYFYLERVEKIILGLESNKS